MIRAATVEVHVTPTKDYIIGVASFTFNNNNINTLKQILQFMFHFIIMQI